MGTRYVAIPKLRIAGKRHGLRLYSNSQTTFFKIIQIFAALQANQENFDG